MANNISVTEGTDRPVATDEIAGISYQRMKLTDGTEDSTVAAIVNAAGGLQVDARPTTKHDQINSAGLTVAATAYTANDTLGTGWEFPNYARVSGGGGRITAVTLLDVADLVTSIDFYMFDRAVTFGTDNALITTTGVSDADGAFFIGKFSIGIDDLTGCRVGSVDSCSIPYFCNATSLFVYAVTRVGHSFFGAATDLKLRIFAELD